MIIASILLSVLLNLHVARADDCQYSTADGTLDLRAFGYQNRPKYTDIHDSSPRTFLTYSFNGCFSYSTKDECQNAAACVTDDLTQTTSLIARQAGRTFTYTHGLSTLIYTDGAGTQLQLFLVCDTAETIQATLSGEKSYLIRIESKCACPGKCSYKPDANPNGLSGGAVFVIILLCVVGTYLVVGVLFQRFVKHQAGVDLIPNRTLWLQLGSHSLHGARFVFSKVRGRGSYESV